MEVVVTGVGVVSPLGLGREAFWTALCQGQSGIRRLEHFAPAALPVSIAAEVRGFDPKPYVVNRKSLKVMSRDAQLGMAASALACRDAGIAAGQVDPDRFGIVLGADQICSPLDESIVTYGRCLREGRFDFQLWGTEGMAASFPLGFLRVLPNMIASHVSIAHDARGPNNTIHQAELSSALAVFEAAGVIQRGTADIMLAGGASSQMHLNDCARRYVMGILSPRRDDPERVMRPFDAARDGQVWGEGASALVLEERRHAEARGATILARLLGWSMTCEPAARNGNSRGDGIRRAIGEALRQAGLDGSRLGHVNAHGLSTVAEDRTEAQALHACLPSTPVTALKSYFGNLGAAGAVTEMAASILSFTTGVVPPTLNYERPDPACPLPIVHGEPLRTANATALSLTWAPIGQTAAIVLGGV